MSNQMRSIDQTQNRSAQQTFADINSNFDDCYPIWAIVETAFTLLSQTAAQPMFNTSTNGALYLTTGTYEFDCQFNLSGISATSGTFGFSLISASGGATFSQSWNAMASMQATSVATATSTSQTSNTAANTALAAAGTGTFGSAKIKGILFVTVAGTITPSLSFSTITGAPTPIVAVGSYFRLQRVSTLTAPTVVTRPYPSKLQWS